MRETSCVLNLLQNTGSGLGLVHWADGNFILCKGWLVQWCSDPGPQGVWQGVCQVQVPGGGVKYWVLDGSSSWDTWNEETSKDDSQFAGFWSKCQQELWYWYPVCGAEEKPALVHLGVGEAQLGEVQDLLCQDGKVCGIQAVLQASVWFPQAEFQWTCSQVRVINRF